MHTRRQIGVAVLGLAALALLLGGVGTARAAFITYTWHNDGGDLLSGSFSVPTSVLAAGQITASDITSAAMWSFATAAGNTYTPSTSTLEEINNPPSNVLHINSTTGAFTDPAGTPNGTSILFHLNSPGNHLAVFADTQWQALKGEDWIELVASGDPINGGSGHWSISGVPAATGVPEPASLTLLATGALGLLGYGWRKRRQAA
jgi:hypothetical protein